MTRKERIRHLIESFKPEDPIDGTRFDVDVLRCLESLERKYSPLTLETVAEFIWFWNDKFFLETPCGNFVWSNPEYDGDNTIVPFEGSIENFCKKIGIPYGRDKGRHTIGGYCCEYLKLPE